jgi:hypothetical protein
MSLTFGLKSSEPAIRFEEIRRLQVYRLDRPRRRPLLQRWRRSLRARLSR